MPARLLTLRRGSTLAGLLLAGAVTGASAQKPPASAASGIYSCVDDQGRRITSDRPIADCIAKEQRVLNSDGSLRTVRPPTMTSDERAEAEARERRAAEERAARADAVRRDRNLMHRYKSEEAHQTAREAALDSVRAAMRISELRLMDLARERKPMVDELEFYKGRPVPAKLKAQIEGNDASVEALHSAMVNQKAELDRINQLYDAELARLKSLWGGAPAGSLGPLPAPPPVLRRP